MYIFTNSIGSYVFDEHIHIKDRIEFSEEDRIKNAFLLSKGEILDSEKKLQEAHPKAKKVEDLKILCRILEHFKDNKYDFYDINLNNTKKIISLSVKEDLLIIQAVKTIEDLDKIANGLCKRLREWYSLYFPESSERIDDNETFVNTILEKDKKTLMREYSIELSMGKDLDDFDLNEMIRFAKKVQSIYEERRSLEEYISKVMKKICPNMHAISGTNIGAKLIAKAGSIEKMVFMPASTIQLLGAEEALFRHIKTGARPPKYGILLQHPIVSKAKKSDKGKVAKAIADKITIAIKVDFFKGEFVGDKLKKDLEKRFSQT